ncbi:MAG TPA: cytochrome c biogenesis protein CcsA [Isosphaeraceae bacterium]|nr:cytochrome c biogenesis protein CcsA [Isosphaeraceae bacterium]
MIDRLSVLCFAGTYGLAFLAELARFRVRSAVRWYVAAGLMALGWLVQTAYLANLALKSPMGPVTTAFGSVMVLSWIVALIGLYLMVRSPKPVAVGMFVLPLVLGLVVGAGWFAPRQSDWLDWGGTVAFWGTVHGVFLLAGAVFTCVAFFAGLMYLAQMRRLKAKRPSRTGLALPSLEQSERINRGAITIAFPLLTFGLLIGIVLSLAARGAGAPAATAHVLRWTDPKVLSALLMWLVFAVLLHARFRPAMRGRSMMVLTIVAFAFLVFAWVGVEALRLRTAHGAAPAAERMAPP